MVFELDNAAMYRRSPKLGVKVVVALAIAALVGGCSARQAYSTLQTSGRSHAACEGLQDADQAASCEADFRKSYDEYARERAEVVSAPKP